MQRSWRGGVAPRFFSGVALIVCEPSGADAGCSDVPKVQFANYCEKDVRLEDWETVIPAGQVVDIVEGRPASQRISWKYADDSTAQADFIELNFDWTGPGACFSGHPSYSSYNGYNMASKYEALIPGTGEPACPDMGAEVSYTLDDCPSGPGQGYLCQGSPDCASQYSQYIRSCSNAINDDGSRTPTSEDITYGANYVNFWCDEKHGFNVPVGTLLNCVEHSVPFVLRITTCHVSGPPPSPPPFPPPSPSPVSQPGQITPVADAGKCLDLWGGDTSNGTPIWLWDCNGFENQAWTFTSDSWIQMIVYQADTSKCIDAGDMSDGKQLQIWDCNGLENQNWGFDADSSAIYLANGAGDATKCMDLAGGDTSAGNAIQVWDCSWEWNQQWYPPSDSGSAVTITLQSNTEVCLDLPGGDTTDGAAVRVWDCNGMDSQKWIFAADSWQIAYAGDPSKCLDAGSMDGNSQLQIWECNGFSQQKWGYDQGSANVYLVDSATDASLCMDLAGDNEVPGSTVLAYFCNSETNQKWSIWAATSANRKATQQMSVV